jgi:hypothetical protein
VRVGEEREGRSAGDGGDVGVGEDGGIGRTV